MLLASNFVAFLLAILFSCSESEAANITALISKSSNPSYAVEGKNFTLQWNYTLDAPLGSAQISIVDDNGKDVNIAISFRTGVVTVQAQFQARFRAQITDTRAELTILAVQRSDEENYKFNLLSSKGGGISEPIRLIVNFSSSITRITGQNVLEGENVTLRCLAEGKPEPTITWTRLSDNQAVTMPLININRNDSRAYRCTAYNGVGIPATRNVSIVVQYQPSLTSIFGNETVNDTDVLWPNCKADGFPAPNITWTRLSTNQTVSMPLTITGKQYEGFYRCIAKNGIGNPATADLYVIVKFYRPFNTYLSTNLTNAAVLNETFYLKCSAEANPAAEYGLYRENTSVANVTAGSQNNGLYAISVSDRVKEVVYRCIPFNSFGDGPTKTLVVKVHHPVEATGIGRNYIVSKGEKNITCPVDGNPKPNITWYKGSEAIGNPKTIENVLIVKDVMKSVCYTCVASNSVGTAVNITHCLIVVDPTPTVLSSTGVSQLNTSAPSIAKPTGSGPEDLAGPPWTIIGAVIGGVVALVIGVGVLTWWVHKQRKCRKDTKIHNSDQGRHGGEVGCLQVQGAYAQSGPPAANGTDSVAEQQIEAEAAIPTYAAVDKSKRSKKQADQRPPEYAVVDKSQKKEKQEVAAIPTYAAVDKDKKKKKSREEVPPVYAEVEKSKKKKKKKIDDKNLYENLDEQKKEKKPGELLYADLGEFQNPSMPAVSISPQPLPAIKKADPYERTDYADITQFLKGNATLPPNDGNGDTEMKPKRPSKKQIQGNDKETPI